MEVPKQFVQLPGRVDALGPPSQDHPKPAPPIWLSRALLRLQQAYPDDAFEATMRYTPVSTTTDLPVSLHSTEPAPPDTKYVYYPRIKCLECPGKLYSPGPGLEARYFEMHLKHKVHREKVYKKLGKTVQLSSSPKPEPNEPGTVRLNGKTMPIKALPATSRDDDDSGEQKVSPSRDPLGGQESRRCSHSVTGAENLEAPVNDVEKLGKPAPLSSAREPAFDEPGTKPEVSSYWSEPDQTDFYNLVRYFGTNWEAVADTMKTKTHVMIENYYHRKIQEGDSGQQLKEEVHRADALRASGANMGPIPALALVGNKKRRFYKPLKQKATGTSRTEGVHVKIEPAGTQ